ncbi:hypothetical protein [Salinibacter ruber]|uniref:hypothetical protein n=1 Tax=Salinibacter ruber TaxID=146919 RepID=UPI002168DEE4|nr:hypothetical protein [Salinibacter ruber]MCS4199748.1 glycosyltransferase involved in cell wall biosynthesis [Salinibacter ruber]
MIRLIHITPELPPTVGGVADYTSILSRRLVEISGGEVEPVLVHAGKESVDQIEVDFPAVDLSGVQSADALASTVQRLVADADERAGVLLEYSGYGYEKHGAPLWLGRAVRRVCEKSGVPLLIMFHELYATGPLWSRKFWVSLVQAYVIRLIVRQSVGVVTNRSDSARWLQKQVESPVHYAPVFSNVGEPESFLSFEERDGYAVVFGGTGKKALYENYGRALARLLRRVGMEKIVDLGPPPDEKITESVGIPVDIRGFLSKADVSAALRYASMGLLCRNPRALAKSGCLAAYMAHGVPSVVATRHSTDPNPKLEEGVHYLSLQRALRTAEKREAQNWDLVGYQSHNWYMNNGHSKEVASIFANLIYDNCNIIKNEN